MDHSPINQNFELNKSRQNNYDFYTIDLIDPIVRQWHFPLALVTRQILWTISKVS